MKIKNLFFPLHHVGIIFGILLLPILFTLLEDYFSLFAGELGIIASDVMYVFSYLLMFPVVVLNLFLLILMSDEYPSVLFLFVGIASAVIYLLIISIIIHNLGRWLAKRFKTENNLIISLLITLILFISLFLLAFNNYINFQP